MEIFRHSPATGAEAANGSVNSEVKSPHPGHLPGCAHMLETQSPADFAMVMSTGIVSIALHLLGCNSGAWLLFGINFIMFAILAVVYVLRLLRYFPAVAHDFKSHGAGPGFLTLVAGTCILGNQFVLLGHAPEVGEVLFTLSLLLWFGILWGVFYHIFIASPKPLATKTLSGAWLLATVSTQALVILGTLLTKPAGWDAETAFFLFTGLFTLGFVLYLFVMGLIFHRFCYEDLEPADLNPTYWINAGAVAITTLAGSELILHSAEAAVLRDMLPFLKGMTLMAWATATFWVPMMFLLGFWRHVVRKFPWTYAPTYWGMVFPMGMYTACTFTLAKAFELDALLRVPEVFIYIAFVAWAATLWGTLSSTWHGLRRTPEA